MWKNKKGGHLPGSRLYLGRGDESPGYHIYLAVVLLSIRTSKEINTSENMFQQDCQPAWLSVSRIYLGRCWLLGNSTSGDNGNPSYSSSPIVLNLIANSDRLFKWYISSLGRVMVVDGSLQSFCRKKPTPLMSCEYGRFESREMIQLLFLARKEWWNTVI